MLSVLFTIVIFEIGKKYTRDQVDQFKEDSGIKSYSFNGLKITLGKDHVFVKLLSEFSDTCRPDCCHQLLN